MLRKFSFLILLSFLMFSGKAQDTTKTKPNGGFRLIINGSEAMYPAVSHITPQYKRTHQQGPNIDLKCVGTGSSLGLRNLIERHCDMALSTRKPTKQEQLMAQDAKVELKEFIVAKEAWVIVANPECGVFRLTKQEVADIFSGKIRNWKEVGGDDLPIHVFIRGNTSGCYKGFKEMFFTNGEDYSESALQLGDNFKVKQQVEKYKGAISFLGYNAYTSYYKEIKALQLSADGGETFVAPGQMTIDDGSYKFVRNCYVYINAADYKIYKDVIEYMMSDKAKTFWEDHGFNPIAYTGKK